MILFINFHLLKIILVGIDAGTVFVQKGCNVALLLIATWLELNFSFVFLCIP